jgi:hypothetical protein
MTLGEAVDHFGIDALLEEIGIDEAISYFGEGSILNDIGIETAKDHFDLIEDYSSEDAYERYGNDLLDHFSASDLRDCCIDWDYIVEYVSDNFGVDDIIDAYGNNKRLFTTLFDYLIEEDHEWTESRVAIKFPSILKPKTVDLLKIAIKAHRESFL